jgi:hypothetical protein
MSLIGAIGLILTAILNPEGIATGNALLAKRLWANWRGGSGAANLPAPATATAEVTT